jgi:hypothetical protein
MKTFAILTSCLLLFWTGAHGIERQNSPGENGPIRATPSTLRSSELSQHSGKTAIVTPALGTHALWTILSFGYFGLSVLLTELLRRAPEGYEDGRGFHFAKATPARRRRQNPRLSQRRRKKRIATGWLIPPVRSFSSTH